MIEFTKTENYLNEGYRICNTESYQPCSQRRPCNRFSESCKSFDRLHPTEAIGLVQKKEVTSTVRKLVYQIS